MIFVNPRYNLEQYKKICLNKFLVHSFMLRWVSFRDKLSSSLNSLGEYLALTWLIMSRCGPSYLSIKSSVDCFRVQKHYWSVKILDCALCPAVKHLGRLVKIWIFPHIPNWIGQSQFETIRVSGEKTTYGSSKDIRDK